MGSNHKNIHTFTDAIKALNESEQRFELLFKNFNQAFALHDIIVDATGNPIDYRYIMVNPVFEKLTGIKAENVIGKRVLEVLPNLEPYWIQTFGKVALTGEAITYENYVKELDKYFETWVYSPQIGQFAVIFSEITVRKHEEQKLIQRLHVLTSPEESKASLSFSDLFDIDEIQRLQDQFAQAMGVASIITLPDGTPITKPSNFSNFCHLIRSTAIGAKNCHYSDHIIGRQNSEGPIIQKCLSGGLCDAGASITVDGQHVANWLIGQVKDNSNNRALVEEYAKRINVDAKSLLKAYDDVNQMPDEKFRAIAQMLFTMAGQLSSMAYHNLTQAQLIFNLKQTEEKLILKNNELLSAEEEIRASNEELTATNDALRESFQELQNAEEKLKQEHLLLRTIIDSIPDAIYVKDLNSRKLLANKADYQNMGLDNEKEALGKNDFDVWPPDIAKTLFEDDQQVTKYGKSIIDREEIILTSNNERTYLLTTKLPLNDQRGNIIGIVGVGRNITKQKQAEVKLLAKNFELLSAEEEIRASNAELLSTNQALVKANLELKSADETISAANEKLMQLNDALDQHNKRLEAAKLKVDEKELWLRESQRIGRIGTYQLNILTNKWESSEVLDEIFGIDSAYEKDVVGWFSLIHPDHANEMLSYFEQHVVLGGNMFDKEYKIVRKNDHATRWLWGRGELTFNLEGKPIKMMGTIQDITDRKKAQEDILVKNIELQMAEEEIRIANEELIKSNARLEQYIIELEKAKEKAEESNRLKTSFLQNISHEIRTPLNAIVGFSGLIANSSNSKEQNLQFSQIIYQGSAQLISIITDIINIATIEAGQLDKYEKDVTINDIFQNLFSQFNISISSKDVKLSYSIPNEPIKLFTDETKLSQILSALISNAIKFTCKGDIEYGCWIKDQNVQFYVKDQGIGIPQELHAVIFERFRQGKSSLNREFGGNGLGLSIAKAYVELLGGSIWLESEMGKGSTFFFTIPIKKM